MSNKTVVICGPTACGKTKLAVSVAKKISGEIVSADSRQVYRDMDIGTGKDLNEYITEGQRISYHLIDIVNPSKIYTLYDYQNDCYRTLNNLFTHRITPIICGGTGLYIEAVLRNYSIPNVPENVKLRKHLMKKEKNKLITMLKSVSKETYRKTDLSSKKRIVRALEIEEYATKNKIQYSSENYPDISPLVLVIDPPRENLKKRISKRLMERLNEGMIDEVNNLMKKGLPKERLFMFGMEYKFITKYLLGELQKKEMIQQLEHSIFQLAKRQVTYFRGLNKRGIDTIEFKQTSSKEIFNVIDHFLGY